MMLPAVNNKARKASFDLILTWSGLVGSEKCEKANDKNNNHSYCNPELITINV